MLADARTHILNYPHLIMFPGIVIALTVLAINLIGDGLRDAMDPEAAQLKGEFVEMNEKTEKFLSVRGLDVVYTSGRKTVHAVNGISFDMDKGETLALVGETGAGKTTIAKAILGILPNPPARLRSGEIILEGEDLLKKRRRKC